MLFCNLDTELIARIKQLQITLQKLQHLSISTFTSGISQDSDDFKDDPVLISLREQRKKYVDELL